MRDVPTSTVKPSATISSRRRSSSRLCATVLPNPMPGSTVMRSSAMPSADGERGALLEERLDLGDDVVVARVDLHRLRVAEHVHEAAVAAVLGHEAGEGRVVAERRDVVDVRRAALRSRRGRPSGFIVSIAQLRAGVARARSMTGMTRARSSSAETGSANGRVDSPPMSRMLAPSRDQAAAVRDRGVALEPLPAVGERVRA